MDLSNRLKALGVQLGASQLQNTPPPVEKSLYSIDKVVEGYFSKNAYGEIFVVEQDYDNDYQHGIIHLATEFEMSILSEWGQFSHLLPIQLNDFVFLDTETSGLAGGTGTYAFLVGLGFRTENGFKAVQFFMRDPSEEPALLAELNRWITPFKSIVTYNGKSFDVPLLNTRHIINGFTPPFEAFHHVDLLHLARRLWKNRLPSRRLGDLEVEILKLGRTDDEVPGWMVPELYFDYLKTHDARPLEGVLYHNRMDIVSLAALFVYTAQLLQDPFSLPEPHSLDLIAIARLYEYLGRLEQATKLFEASLEQGLPKDFYTDTLLRYAEIAKKQADLDTALALWQKAVDHGSLQACLELAKINEHQYKNINQAVDWVNQATRLVENSSLSRAQKRVELSALEHRLERLNKKLQTSK
jgi:uncharacterized protein YprB with RNaseH-like and TPR domain